MLPHVVPHFGRLLDRARRELGMTYPVLAERSGVPVPTLKRMLGGGLGKTSFETVAAVAEALGVPLGAKPMDADAFRECVAREKARRLVSMVQGTSALEAQGLEAERLESMVERTAHELLAGPPRRLWAK